MLLDLSNLNTLGFYIVLAIIAVFVVSVALLLRSGHGYSTKEADAHAVDFPAGLKEAHGRIPAFLWVYFAAMLMWAVAYFAVHRAEFGIIFAH